MKTMRMPKGWTLVGTNAVNFGIDETREEKFKREQRFRKAIRNVKHMKIEELEEESEKLFSAREAKNANLLKAFNEKKLKSKTLIQMAKTLKKRQKKAESLIEATEA